MRMVRRPQTRGRSAVVPPVPKWTSVSTSEGRGDPSNRQATTGLDRDLVDLNGHYGASDQPGRSRPAFARFSDPEDRHQALLVLRLDAGHHLQVLLEARAAQLGGQQLIDLEDARGV